MHTRALCELHGLQSSRPDVCSNAAIKRARVFNSGVMVLSYQGHTHSAHYTHTVHRRSLGALLILRTVCVRYRSSPLRRTSRCSLAGRSASSSAGSSATSST